MKTYLMWIGSKHYQTIEDFREEARKRGVSKRIPNLEMAKFIVGEKSMIFLAHDEGETHDCPDCMANIECPECRKDDKEIHLLQEEIEDLLDSIDDDSSEKDRRRVHLFASKRMKKIETYRERKNECSCKNNKTVGGSGGLVTFGNGKKWDYRKYNYWLHQPEKWTPEKMGGVVKKEICQSCGGTGIISDAKIFGLFLPDRVEYIANTDDDKKKKKEIEKQKVRFITQRELSQEILRECGERVEGGSYLVSDDTERTRALIRELQRKQIIKRKEVKVYGGFIEFNEPVEMELKRFRGLKKWSPDIKSVKALEKFVRSNN